MSIQHFFNLRCELERLSSASSIEFVESRHSRTTDVGNAGFADQHSGVHIPRRRRKVSYCKEETVEHDALVAQRLTLQRASSFDGDGVRPQIDVFSTGLLVERVALLNSSLDLAPHVHWLPDERDARHTVLVVNTGAWFSAHALKKQGSFVRSFVIDRKQLSFQSHFRHRTL